jgi:NAD(P)-dependent dehydrogenase (short-subunit alcohol dehydrogenase family)
MIFSMTSPQVVLITGTSSGIGYATAQNLAQKGYTVFATMRQIDGKNATVAAELRSWATSQGVNLHVLELDVTDNISVQTAVQQVMDVTGRIDVLINNAGIGILGVAEAFTDEQMHRLFETNVFGPMRVVQAVLPTMRQQKEGLLMYISSTGGVIPYPFMGMYGAAKAALDGMALAFNSEVYSLGIDTIVIQAGTHSTPFATKVELSSRQAIWEDYGSIGQAGYAMMDSMTAYFASGLVSTAESLSDHIANYIAMPAGQRPLKVALGSGTDGFDALNHTLLPLQVKAIEALGFGQFLKR